MVAEMDSETPSKNESENQSSQTAPSVNDGTKKPEPNLAQMEEVMTKGMEFLTGIYTMGTGNDIAVNSKPKVNINKETGEISITFKVDF
jgi:hypothetical protein